jgi:hypothetical protein
LVFIVVCTVSAAPGWLCLLPLLLLALLLLPLQVCDRPAVSWLSSAAEVVARQGSRHDQFRG